MAVRHGSVAADGVIGVAADQHELPGGRDDRTGARLHAAQILKERQENEAARKNETLGKTLQLLARRQ